MQYLEVSGAVRPVYGSLGVKRLRNAQNSLCSWDASFSTVTRVRSGRPRNRGSIQSKESSFSLIQVFQQELGPINLPAYWVQGYFPENKAIKA